MEETENLGFARLDHDRSRRKGGVETIFCQGKTCEQVAAIFERFAAHDGCALGTRASKEQYEAVLKRIPAASYNELGRVIYLNREKVTKKAPSPSLPAAPPTSPSPKKPPLPPNFLAQKCAASPMLA